MASSSSASERGRLHTGVGYGGVPAESRAAALRVGPISLGSLGAITRDQLPLARLGQSRFPALESIAVIEAGAAVTVAIPAHERQFVGFIYTQDKFRADGAYRIRDLDWVVRFQACRDPNFNKGIGQFDGGVVVAGRRCFHLDFYIDGRGGVVRRRVPATGPCHAPFLP
jgi:hypothetical protein